MVYQRSLSLLSPENSLLLVVDVQEHLMPVIVRGDSIVFNVQRLLEAAQVLDIPIIVSEQYPKGLGATVIDVARIIPKSVPIIAKRAFSVCAVEEICREIENRNVPKIILCGVEGHICVLQSALDLLTMGKETILVTDAAGSRCQYDYETALRRLESSGVTLTTTESILFEWCNTSEHPQFKIISRLVQKKLNAPEQGIGS
ncbi:MAG: isochorismatase family protein [Planctomycetaceae bacterium]|jgi:nicotinamidase-related amidase|nr:isochorismatase family protein [Planctomycetaceae bacterium]